MWDGFSETLVRRIRGRPFELVFNPISARGFVPFTQQDNGELIKGLELYYKRCLSVIKILRKLTIDGIFIRQEKRKYSHVERQGVRVHLKRVK